MIKELFNLSGRTAFITGGSKGIGKACARGLAECGANIAISARHEDELKKAKAEISDGLSTTILFGEKHVMLSAFRQQPGVLDTSDFLVYSSRNAFSVGRIGGPSAPLALSQEDQYRNQFGSWHPGVVPILFGDGSTQTLRNSMSTSALGYLCGSQEGASPGDYQ